MKGIGLKQLKPEIELTSVGLIKKNAQLVSESISRIINTSPGERPREAIGCRIKELIFQPNDYITATLGAYYVMDAIANFEPRVTVENIDVINDPNNNKMIIKILFRLVEQPEELFSTTVTVII